MSSLSEGVANGPSRGEHLENDAQIWERPWTLEEMRQSSANWSLAADSGLFLFLQDFSHRMLSKTHEIEKQLDCLIRDTKATDSCLHTVFNDFLMLSNTQFIENRVYDEEVEETVAKAEALEKPPEQEKTREQKEAELIPKMQEAVNYGLRVLESAFEHLDIKAGNSDSEDEEVTDRVEAILEPKDLYVDRPLPYLIGSQAFMEQEDVGLGDLSSDEMSVDSDRDSVVESEEDKQAVHSDEDFNPEEDEGHNHFKKKSSTLSYEDEEEEEDEEDEDSDIFGESDKEDDDDTKNTGPSSFADELAARIKGEPPHKQEGDRASLASKKKSKGRKEAKTSKSQAAEDDGDDMFKPPKMDDEDFTPFGGKSGLFSGGRGLFDDDDEGDLFSEAPKTFVPEERERSVVNENTKGTAKSAESGKPGKKIPADNGLFSSGNDSDSVGSKENGIPVPKANAPPKLVPAAVGGGLFDEDEDEDDFFTGKSSEKDKSKPKKAVDLFDEDDDEDGDIFNAKFSTPNPAQPKKKEVVLEQDKPPEKKMPAGAISTFGPGTKSLLSEGLKKRRPSTSEESEKSEENGPAPDVSKAAAKPSPKPQTRGLFSDDEDAQVFPTIPRSQSKPEPTSQSKANKAPLSFFDDEEEEDLFASASKSKPKASSANKASPLQPSKTTSSSLFSDDEDQWTGSATKTDTKPAGMKASVSAPSSLLSAKTTPKSILFDDEEEDDLFAPIQESSQKKTQKVALLFEDEGDDEDKGSLFGAKPAVDTVAAAAKTPAAASESSSPLQKSAEVAVSPSDARNKALQEEKPLAKTPQTLSAPQNAEGKKKLAGAVSLFGGINVLEKKKKRTSLLDEDDGDDDDDDDGFLSKASPAPHVREDEEKKEEKVIAKTVSLFEDEDEDESEWTGPIFTPSKPTGRNTQKPSEEQPQVKSTGVFQDEELLFSHTQQKDNDPDVDLFATSGKAVSPKPSSAKAASLFADEEEDDLFAATKRPKAPPPKVAEKPSKPADAAPLASPESVSEIQANLKINTAALLPGAAPSFPGMGPSSSSGVSSSSLSPSPATTPVGAQTDGEAVSFDSPVQVTTLHSAHKSRTRGAVHRRPQSRAARQHAAQRSGRNKEETVSGDAPGPKPSPSGLALPLPDKSSHTSASLQNSPAPTTLPASSPSQPPVPEVSTRPSVLALPASKDSSKVRTKVLPSPDDDDDLFGSDGLFEAASVANTPSSTKQTTKKTQPQASSGAESKEDKDKSTFPSIFDDNTDDLFKKVKPRSAAKKAKASPFLEGDDGDEEDADDIFGVSNSSTPSSTGSKEIKNSRSFIKQDIFQDEDATVPKVHKKHKEKYIDASLFDDDVDIFADLTDTLKPKQKSKTKGETKSIFDDDMDEIFSPSTVKTVSKVNPSKSKKKPPSQETSATADPIDLFDDPLNALGGN